MIAWFIIGVLGLIALWVISAVAVSVLRLIKAIADKPKDQP